MADINPWVRSSLYDPGKWDTAGPGTAMPWLHPPTWTPGQGWGLLNGNLQASNVTGGWGGLRDDLVREGLSFQAAYLGQLAANPVGGVRQGGTSWRGDLCVGPFADLQRLFGWQRTYFAASMAIDHGNDSLTPVYVDNQFPVQSSSSDENNYIRLVHVAVGKQLFDNRAEVNGGRVVTGDQFATLRQACTSLNQAICGNPIAAAQNITFPSYPNAAWGANVELKPAANWYAKTGAYLVEEELLDPSNGGLEFGAPDGSGPLILGEFGYVSGPFNQGSRGVDLSALDVSGTYKLGAYYDGESLEDLSTGESQRHTWGVYAMGEQRLYRENRNSDDGLWTWLSLSYAPPDVNRVEFMVAGGVSYNGLLEGRPNDVVALNFARGQFSDRLDGQSSEYLIEADYRFQAFPWVYVEPNVQYVINPEGRSSTDNALVVGFGLGIDF